MLKSATQRVTQTTAAPLIPRSGLIWILIAQCLAVTPHLFYLPVWTALVWVVCALWRVQIYRMRAVYPGKLTKLLLALAGVAGVFLSRGSIIGVEGGVALLVTAFMLKLIEMKTQRDALVVIFLGFFIVLTSYLFDDGLLAAIYSLLPLTALIAALIGLQPSSRREQPKTTLKTASFLLLQAVPLMVLLFLFFPRLDPLWSLPQPSDKATTGLSDNMAPGDIAELSQSSALAFRASFDGDIPEKNQLYWRALTMDYFDGRTWSHPPRRNDFQAPRWQPQGERVDYRVIMQPTSQSWLFSLDVSATQQGDARQMHDYRLQRRGPINSAYQYRASAWLSAARDLQLTARDLQRNLQLPRQSNPAARQWAEQLSAQYSEPEQLVQAVLRHFNQAPFHYTLKPPKLGQHSVDEFLFDSQSGFCEHYSSAMVFVLRAAGIPARIVTGYQGGEINQKGNFVQVRQFDAHAWVEYWLAGKGWITADPTFQVAPNRIELGLQEALQDQSEFLAQDTFSALRFSHVGWLTTLRMEWESLNHLWQSKVLGYQRERQLNWLSQWLGRVDWVQIGSGLLIGTLFLLLLLWLGLSKPWQQPSNLPLARLAELQQLLLKRGISYSSSQGLRAYRQQVADLPNAEPIVQFLTTLEAQQYAGKTISKHEFNQQWRAAKKAAKNSRG